VAVFGIRNRVFGIGVTISAFWEGAIAIAARPILGGAEITVLTGGSVFVVVSAFCKSAIKVTYFGIATFVTFLKVIWRPVPHALYRILSIEMIVTTHRQCAIVVAVSGIIEMMRERPIRKFALLAKISIHNAVATCFIRFAIRAAAVAGDRVAIVADLAHVDVNVQISTNLLDAF